MKPAFLLLPCPRQKKSVSSFTVYTTSVPLLFLGSKMARSYAALFHGGLVMCILALATLCHQPTMVSAKGGPCSTYVNAKRIVVNTPADLYKRTLYPSNTTVTLAVATDLKIPSTITLSEQFSCTILTSAGDRSPTIFLDDNATAGPVLVVWNASNVLIQNINFHLPLDAPGAADGDCESSFPHDAYSGSVLCPSILIYRSWGIQIAKSTHILGRIDVQESTQVSLDSLAISTLPSDVAAVDFGFVGDGPNRVPAAVSLTNSVVTGAQVGAFLRRMSVGVAISNNVFRNQGFAGIQCGTGQHNVGDCMLSSITQNYITVTPGYPTASDAAAIYFASHWINPGNYLSCNYAVGGVQCMYLDWASSGVQVDGMVCFNQSSGLKLNTGHSNNVSSFVVIGANLPGWISCQNFELNNCRYEIGKFWDAQRIASYSSPAFRKAYPWMTDFCKQTQVGGVGCNPAGSAPTEVTGGCSGIPTGNRLELVIVDPRKPRNTPTYLSCANVSVVPALNSLNYTAPPLSSKVIQFADYNGLDFGVAASSPVYNLYPAFRSCPKSQNGVQKVADADYLARYNVKPGVLVGRWFTNNAADE